MGAGAPVVLMFSTAPEQSVTEMTALEEAGTLCTCSNTISESMVAVVSMVLRLLLAMARATTLAMAIRPTASTTMAISSSIRVIPEEEDRGR